MTYCTVRKLSELHTQHQITNYSKNLWRLKPTITILGVKEKNNGLSGKMAVIL